MIRVQRLDSDPAGCGGERRADPHGAWVDDTAEPLAAWGAAERHRHAS
jgi:hypothetical protein